MCCYFGGKQVGNAARGHEFGLVLLTAQLLELDKTQKKLLPTHFAVKL